MKKALASNPARRLSFIGDQVAPKNPKNQSVSKISNDSVIPYDRVTLLMHPDLAEWLRRRKYWDRVDMTDEVEEALQYHRTRVGKEYEPIPPKKRARA
jgi:hypothetical protein